MKKLLYLAAIGSVLFAASCSKDSSSTPTPSPTPSTPTIPTDGWNLDATKYTTMTVVRQESQFLVNAIDATTPKPYTFGVSFHGAYPTASGSYKIVAMVPDPTMKYPAEKINDGEIVLLATVPNTAGGSNITYYTTGTESKSATVTVTNGKIKIEVPEITVTNADNKTMKVTGTISEK